MFMPPPGMSYGQYAQLYGGFPSDTPSISFQPQPSPFARSIRPDRQVGEALMQGPTSFGGRMAAPGTDMATGRPMNPALFPFNPDPRFSSSVIRRPIPRPNPYAGPGRMRPSIPFPTPTPDIFPPQQPPMFPRPNPYGGGGIGGFFNQLAMMSPEQYTMGMDRFNQFNQRFGSPMGGGFGMFNQLAQLTPEQYTAGMDRFNQFNQRFGQMFSPRPQVPQIPPPMPPPMTGGPRPNPYGGFPISRPFGGGFGGGFNPYMIDRQTRLASGEIIPAGDGFSIAALQGNPLQGGGMMGTTNPDGTLSVGAGAMPQPSGMSAPAVQPPDPNRGAIFRADPGEPMINTAQSGGGGVF